MESLEYRTTGLDRAIYRRSKKSTWRSPTRTQTPSVAALCRKRRMFLTDTVTTSAVVVTACIIYVLLSDVLSVSVRDILLIV